MSTATLLPLELTSDPKLLPEIRRRVRSWAGAQGWSEQQAGEIALALDEVVTNIIVHAYGGRSGQRILVWVEAIDDPVRGAGIELRVRDFGKQVDPAQIRGRDLDDVRPGGLGVHIIRAMTSTVEYRRAEGGGMLAIMRKYRTHTADAEDNSLERP